MSNPIDQEREAFEAVITKDGWPHADRADRLPSGDYSLPRVQNKWLGWQARAQLPAGGAVQSYGRYITRCGEMVAGIALRQLGAEKRWVEIRDLNAHAFPEIGANDMYPPGTELIMPVAPHPVSGEQKPAVRELSDASRVPDDYRSQATGYRAGWNDCVRCLADAPPAAQDVSGLATALQACRDELLHMIDRHNVRDPSDGSWLYDHQTVCEADAALESHRAQAQGGDAKPECKCSMRTRLVGDGCSVCNPDLAAEYAKDDDV